MDDVLINKSSIIERCIERVNEEYFGHEHEFAENYTRQDSIILNLERAIQACIDLGAYCVRKKKLGIPQESREVFQFLEQAGMLEKASSFNLQKMVGFRNIAVHNYKKLDLDIVRQVVESRLIDMLDFKLTCFRILKS